MEVREELRDSPMIEPEDGIDVFWARQVEVLQELITLREEMRSERRWFRSLAKGVVRRKLKEIVLEEVAFAAIPQEIACVGGKRHDCAETKFNVCLCVVVGNFLARSVTAEYNGYLKDLYSSKKTGGLGNSDI